MGKLSAESYTRVTLALDIVGKLTSGPHAGYHELSIIKHQIDLHDTITLEDAATTSVVCEHPDVPRDAGNICWRAVELVRDYARVDRHVAITIDKRIPVMGGLAGGSANAATTLMLLDKLWQLHLGYAQLSDLGRRLGMDVPFYFVGGTAFDSEAGGVLAPIRTGLSMHLVLVIPAFGVSTKEAYQAIDYGEVSRRAALTRSLKEGLEADDFDEVLDGMHNDFELSVFTRYPDLSAIKNRLLECGCLNAVMSGSGSTIIGVTVDREHAEELAKELCDFPQVLRAVVASSYIP